MHTSERICGKTKVNEKKKKNNNRMKNWKQEKLAMPVSKIHQFGTEPRSLLPLLYFSLSLSLKLSHSEACECDASRTHEGDPHCHWVVDSPHLMQREAASAFAGKFPSAAKPLYRYRLCNHCTCRPLWIQHRRRHARTFSAVILKSGYLPEFHVISAGLIYGTVLSYVLLCM